MSSVHNFSEYISEISPRNYFILRKIVVEHIPANGQISVVEVIISTPTLRTEFLSSKHEGMEKAQSEQARFKFGGFFVTLI